MAGATHVAGALPAGARAAELADEVANVPSGAGAQGGVCVTSPMQIQQKMQRQRALAIERRRMAGRHAAGGMAQANQIPLASTALHLKSARSASFVPSEDSPGSFAERAEKAFQATSAAGKKTQLPAVEVGRGEEPTASGAMGSRVLAHSVEDKAAMRSSAYSTIDEIEVFDCDLHGHLPEAQRCARKERGGGTGWDLHVEQQRPPAFDACAEQVIPLSEESTTPGRRWYKPWGGKPKPVAQASAAGSSSRGTGSNAVERTAVCAFGAADRWGSASPEPFGSMGSSSNEPGSLAWGGGGSSCSTSRSLPRGQSQTSTDAVAGDSTTFEVYKASERGAAPAGERRPRPGAGHAHPLELVHDISIEEKREYGGDKPRSRRHNEAAANGNEGPLSLLAKC